VVPFPNGVNSGFDSWISLALLPSALLGALVAAQEFPNAAAFDPPHPPEDGGSMFANLLGDIIGRNPCLTELPGVFYE